MYLSPHLVNWNYARISDSPTFPRSLPSIRCKRSKRHVFEFLIQKKKTMKTQKRKKKKSAESASTVVEKRGEKTSSLDFGLASIPRRRGISRIFSHNKLIVWSMKIKIAAHPSSLAEGPRKVTLQPATTRYRERKEMTRTDPRSFFPSPLIGDESTILIYCSPL